MELSGGYDQMGVFPVVVHSRFAYIAIMLKLACAFYVAWLLTVLIFQFSEPLRRRMKRLPFFLAGLVPTWRLFAPRPVDGDLCLYYRTRKDEGSIFSPWQSLQAEQRTPLAISVFYDPGRSMARALQDVFLRVCRADSSRNVYYQLLLQHVIHRIRREPFDGQPPEGQIQFRIERRIPEEVHFLFESHVHPF
jgi:hypothetical protein